MKFLLKLLGYFVEEQEEFKTDSEYKIALLTAFLGVTAVFTCSFYFVFDYIAGMEGTGPYYLVFIFCGLVTLALVKLRLYLMSKITIIWSGYFILLVLASSESIYTGASFYFIVLTIAAFAVFGYRHYIFTLLAVLTGLTLIYIVGFTEIRLAEFRELTPEYVLSSFLINVIVALITTFLIMYFLIMIIFKSEQKLIEKERKNDKLNEELRESEKQLGLTIKGLNLGLWNWNLQTNEVEVSTAWKRMMEYERNELNFFNFDAFKNFVHADDAFMVKKAIEDHLAFQTPYLLDFRLKTKQGNYIWVTDSGQAEFDTEGQPVRMYGSILDITEKKRSEIKILRQNELLEKANQELDRFVYSTSHDLRAPLKSVLGLVNVMELDAEAKNKTQYLDMIKNRVQNLDDFIQEIIDFSKNARTSVVAEEIVFADLVDEVRGNIEYLENYKTIKFCYEFDPDIKLKLDIGRMKVVLNNLVNNAVKYHLGERAEKQITIGLKVKKKGFRLLVKDNGPGMSEDVKNNAFEMFYRGTATASGSGLGLYIVKETVDKLDGSIDLKSQINSGTTFDIKIPIINNN